MGRWGAIFGQEALVMGHSGVGWAVPGRVAELAPSAGGALHVCPPESNPQRVQEKQQQQQGVVPYLGTFLGDLQMLHLEMGIPSHEGDPAAPGRCKEL
ncbi:uncharacterized protein LOC131402210 isoform X8 [Diceros bicornis minor]|uniref:uncharacterized protein LOC131402210 isoform X8 n=1 Tax=Diceros bicornis minor TaxID=77932 RepID=UPI0026F2C5D2|nr:uncharacterized protein LOC131402210 isoform X8 [Diceros bicornis minor]